MICAIFIAQYLYIYIYYGTIALKSYIWNILNVFPVTLLFIFFRASGNQTWLAGNFPIYIYIFAFNPPFIVDVQLQDGIFTIEESP